MKIVQHHRLAVADRERKHRPPDCLRADLRGQCLVLRGGRGGLGNVSQRHIQCWKPLQFRTEHIRGQSKQPGGKAALATPSAEPAPRADKGLLRQFFGAFAIAAVAPGHIHQRPLPAANDPLERLHLARKHTLHIGQVLALLVCRRVLGKRARGRVDQS